MDVLLDLDVELARRRTSRSGGRRVAIESAVRSAIREARLAEGTVLPSSRALAAELGVARGTVVDAYDQLVAEGWLTTRPGGRTTVAARVDPACSGSPASTPPAPTIDLRAGAGDLAAFPASPWAAAVRRVLRSGPADALDYVGPWGRPELRAALSGYLARARGVVARPDQVVICSGVDHVLAVVTRALVADGRSVVAMEDPCLPFQRTIVAGAGATVAAARVDPEGVDVDTVAAAGAGAAVVTPARQSLLGTTLAPARRSALVAWARAAGAVVVEDDYDGELRYDRQPIGAVQGLAPESVVYAGTLSKSLAPGLRIAWAVVPDVLAPGVDAALGPHSSVSSLDQLVVADLLAAGTIDRHLRRMRAVYRRRRDEFVSLLAARAPSAHVEGVAAGLHALVGWPAGAVAEAAVLAEADARGIGLTPLAPAWHGEPGVEGVVAGYGRPPAHDAPRRFAAFADLMADMLG